MKTSFCENELELEQVKKQLKHQRIKNLTITKSVEFYKKVNCHYFYFVINNIYMLLKVRMVDTLLN